MPIKHGLYSKIRSRRLRGLIERVQGGEKDHLDLKEEITLLRALILNLWECDGRESSPDAGSLSLLIDRLRKVVETANRVERPGYMSIHSVVLLKEAMAHAVAAAVRTGDPDLDERICREIEDTWMRTQVHGLVR